MTRALLRRNTGRGHQGADVALRAPNGEANVIAFPTPSERIRRRTALGGLTSEYQRAA